MKNLLKILLLSIPVTVLFYFPKFLVPAVDAKSLMVRSVLAVASVLFFLLFLSDKKFRNDTLIKLDLFWKNPLGKYLTASFVILILSTIFAFSRYVAFFGTATRGEGFVGLIFFYVLTLFVATVFEKKDWLTFWKITVYCGIFTFLKEFFEFLGGAYRPGSVMDNPIFLAGYFLIIIYAGLILFSQGFELKNPLLKWTGIVGIISSILGIFITQSRGVMLGVFIATIVSFIYIITKSSENPSYKNFRKIAVIILSTVVLIGMIFLVTRNAPAWKKIPGFSRISEFSLNDSTTLSRIENAKLTLRAISPKGNNIKNTLIGWGWDNYVFAWQKNYDPKLYEYDTGIFDRAHNKVLDVLVMNGILGLIAYLFIWFYIIRSGLLIGKKIIIEGAAVIFFSTAFFVQNLFVFDTIISYVSFFVIIGYMIFESNKKYE